jgi:hypothetical protein
MGDSSHFWLVGRAGSRPEEKARKPFAPATEQPLGQGAPGTPFRLVVRFRSRPGTAARKPSASILESLSQRPCPEPLSAGTCLAGKPQREGSAPALRRYPAETRFRCERALLGRQRPAQGSTGKRSAADFRVECSPKRSLDRFSRRKSRDCRSRGGSQPSAEPSQGAWTLSTQVPEAPQRSAWARWLDLRAQVLAAIGCRSRSLWRIAFPWSPTRRSDDNPLTVDHRPALPG